jgi:6-phosphogluconolactonase (cycloisomerase 2 family)
MAPAALVVLAISLCATSPANAQSKNLVYVNSNNFATGQNSVQGFSNDGAGNLTALPGSPYLTNGTGVGPGGGSDAQWDSDQEVIVNRAGTMLLAVNGHTNTVAIFNINSDGSLTAVAGSPFASNGQDPASLGWMDNAFGGGVSMLTVVNKNSDPGQTGGVPNYTNFKVDGSGNMTMISGSELDLPFGSSPAQALVRLDGPKQFFGIEFLNNDVATYKSNKNGILSQISVNIPPVTFPTTLGAVLHPKLRVMYVDLPIQREVAVYKFDSTGNLTYMTAVPNDGVAVCWSAINATGTRLYTSQTPSSTIDVYDITHAGTPTEIQSFTVSGTGAEPAHMRLDPTQKFLYAVDRLGSLHVINVDSNGMLSETVAPKSLNLPAGTVPLGVAILTK